MTDYLYWRDRLATANDPAMFPIAYVDAVVAGDGKLWATGKAAVVTRICLYPGGAKVVRWLAAAGELTEILEILTPQIEAWARENGCTHSLIEGRDGWRRFAAAHDYQHHQTLIMKVL